MVPPVSPTSSVKGPASPSGAAGAAGVTATSTVVLKKEEKNEAARLGAALRRFAGLLQVGFGAAGAQIIKKCIASSGDGVNPMIEGSKVFAIFGFSDIRRFTDATECLKERVMAYVNSIADVVHKEAHGAMGAANKNVGDAFLVVWQLSPFLASTYSAAESTINSISTMTHTILDSNDDLFDDDHDPNNPNAPSPLGGYLGGGGSFLLSPGSSRPSLSGQGTVAPRMQRQYMQQQQPQPQLPEAGRAPRRESELGVLGGFQAYKRGASDFVG